MAGRTPASGVLHSALAGLIAPVLLLVCLVPAQELSKRLILTDGSYQLATKWEVKGDRVRYFSAERGEWEEVPKSMVDWAATDKYEKDWENGVPSPGAAELDKELAAERRAEEARRPEVAPGLRLPEDAGVLLLDSYENQPQLVELQQHGSEIKQDRKGNVMRAAINPMATTKQNIEVPGAHAQVQAHVALPAIYLKLEPTDPSDAAANADPSDRFHIVHMQVKADKRMVGDIKVSIYGKAREEQKLVPTSMVDLTGGWIKITPLVELETGEYAVVEMLGKEGINSYVWDFGVNPSARANADVTKPEAPGAAPAANSPPELKTQP